MIILTISTTGSTSVTALHTDYKTCKKVERSYQVFLPKHIKSVDVRCVQ